jgi:hypothetical protein
LRTSTRAAVALVVVFTALAAPGCSETRKHNKQGRGYGFYDPNAAAGKQADIVRNVAPQKGWSFWRRGL